MLLGQPVAVPQPRPAVGPVHEFIAEAEAQLREAAQVGDFGQAHFAAGLPAHADGIVVIEPQGVGHLKTVIGEDAAQGRVVGDVFTGQDFPGEGAGIFRVEIDGAAAQSVPENPGAAQTRQEFRPGARLSREPGGHVGQNN